MQQNDCPLKRSKEWCPDCRYSKQGLCDYPYSVMGTKSTQLEKANAIINDIALEYGKSCLLGRRKDAELVSARQMAMYRIRQETNLSLDEVGYLLGGRTPATVTHGYQKIAGMIK